MADKRYADIARKPTVTATAQAKQSTAIIPYMPSIPNLSSPGGSILKGNFIGKLFQYTFYASVLSFFLFLILTFLHFTVTPIFSFGPEDEGVFGIPTASREQLCYTKSAAVPDASCNFISLEPYGYTLSLDIHILGEFGSGSTPRILAYRSPNAIELAPSDTSIQTIQSSKLPNTNMILYVDALKNDLKVYTKHEGGASLDTLLLENIPLRRPFRITLVFTDTYFEVYKNGYLERSFPLSKPPIQTPPGAYLFGPPPIVNGLIKVANISYWNYPLTSRAVRVHGTKAIPTAPFESTKTS